MTGTGTANTLNGESGLTYDGSTLAVAGTATMDGLTVATTGNITLDSGTGETHGVTLSHKGSYAEINGIEFAQGSTTYGNNQIKFLNMNSTGSVVETMRISGGGDISFYEDTGTTAKLFWDASAECLSIGVTGTETDRRFQISSTSPSTATTQYGIVANPTMSNDVTGSIYNIYSQANVASGASLTNLYSVYIGATGLSGSTITNNYGLYQAGASEKNYFAGNVGIGTTSPPSPLSIFGTGTSSPQSSTAQQSYDNALFRINNFANSSVGLSIGSAGSNVTYIQTSYNEGTTSPLTLNPFGGNVGIGTTDPDQPLHVVGTRPLRLQRSGVGEFEISIDNTISGDSSDFVIEPVSGSNSAGFQVRTRDTAGLIIEALNVNHDGNVGIGTDGPAAKLHVDTGANTSEGAPHLRLEGSGYSGFHWLNGTAYYIGQNSNGRQLRMYSGSNSAVGVYLTNGGTSWQSYSDERLKENIQDIGSVIEKIKDIRCVTYNRKDVDDENKIETIGFIAQDFIGKFDQVLDESKVLDTDEETRYSMKYTETIPILMKAIQEQQTIIDDLKSRIEALEE
jgi:hypothetical protein